jgi:hypothetical protein
MERNEKIIVSMNMRSKQTSSHLEMVQVMNNIFSEPMIYTMSAGLTIRGGSPLILSGYDG